ncbi:hypothetical protein [Nocardia sp. BMG51109]|uniref:hypothetical protein n=1 Tax=Nocardia sp. BMG51109 TaxID=1056816 RepID=UPI0004679AA0|nr:hypothetical protein [Nocardia sp. BMG51109]
MTTPPHDDEPTPRPGRTGGRPRGRVRSAADAARLARIFGDTLPQTTSDERGPDGERAASADEWLRSQVPPHHE